jgi:hypothetical protein
MLQERTFIVRRSILKLRLAKKLILTLLSQQPLRSKAIIIVLRLPESSSSEKASRKKLADIIKLTHQARVQTKGKVGGDSDLRERNRSNCSCSGEFHMDVEVPATDLDDPSIHPLIQSFSHAWLRAWPLV